MVAPSVAVAVTVPVQSNPTAVFASLGVPVGAVWLPTKPAGAAIVPGLKTVAAGMFMAGKSWPAKLKALMVPAPVAASLWLYEKVVKVAAWLDAAAARRPSIRCFFITLNPDSNAIFLYGESSRGLAK